VLHCPTLPLRKRGARVRSEMIRPELDLEAHRHGRGRRRRGDHCTGRPPGIPQSHSEPLLPPLSTKASHRRGHAERGSSSLRSGKARLPQLHGQEEVDDGRMQRAVSEVPLRRSPKGSHAAAIPVHRIGLDFDEVYGQAKRRALSKQAARRAAEIADDVRPLDGEFTSPPLLPAIGSEKPRIHRPSAMAMIQEARRLCHAGAPVDLSPSHPVGYPQKFGRDVFLHPLDVTACDASQIQNTLGQTALASFALKEISSVAQQIQHDLGEELQKNPSFGLQDSGADKPINVGLEEPELEDVPEPNHGPIRHQRFEEDARANKRPSVASDLIGVSVDTTGQDSRRSIDMELTPEETQWCSQALAAVPVTAGEDAPPILDYTLHAAVVKSSTYLPQDVSVEIPASPSTTLAAAAAQPSTTDVEPALLTSKDLAASCSDANDKRRHVAAASAPALTEQLKRSLSHAENSLFDDADDFELSDKDEDSVRLVFKRFQVPNDKDMHAEDVAELLMCLGYVVPDPAAVRTLCKEITPYDYLGLDDVITLVVKYARLERERFRALYNKYDVDRSGDISTAEVRQLVPSLGLIPLRQMIQEAMEIVDMDGSGTLSFNEFIRFLTVYRHAECFNRDEVAKLQKIFDAFSKSSGNGTMKLVPIASLADAYVQAFGLFCEPAALRIARRIASDLSSKVGFHSGPGPDGSRGLAFQEFLMYARRLREDEHEQCRKEFARVDSDGSGRVSKQELEAALKCLGYSPIKAVTEEVLKEVLGKDSTKKRLQGSCEGLDFGEFFHFVLTFRERDGFTLREIEELQRVFDRFDEDGSGELAVLELSDVLRHIGYTIGIDSIHIAVAQVDRNCSNQLDFVEFKRLMRLHREIVLDRARVIFNAKGGDGAMGLLPGTVLAAAITEALGCKPPGMLLASAVRGKGVDFDGFIVLLDMCRRASVGKHAKKAGFADEEVDVFQSIFDKYDLDKSGDIDSKEIQLVLNDLGIVNRTREEQRAMLGQLDLARNKAREAGASGVSAEGSAHVAFWEFLQLLRLVRVKNDKEEEDRVAAAAQECEFKQQEVTQFREIYLQWSKQSESIADPDEDGHRRSVNFSSAGGENAELGLTMDALKRLLRIGLKLKISPRQHDELEMQYVFITNKSRLDLPGFLKLMRWLLTSNFANVNETAAQVAQENVVAYFKAIPKS